MSKKQISESVNAIEKLLELFKFERYCYLAITIISLFVLLAIAVVLLVSDFKNHVVLVVAMFVPSGAIAYTYGRVLKMWSDALQFLAK
jgi:hypothetical protein